MKKIRDHSWPLLLLVLLLLPAAFSQEEAPPQRGSVEFGFRHVWGDVYGRPDLPFTPRLDTSSFNEYRDFRSGVFIRNFRGTFDDILGSHFYVDLQSQKSFYDDQSYLATFGQYGKFRAQFRYDEIPHIYSNTTRTLLTQVEPGVFTMPLAIRTTLAGTAGTDIPATSLAQVSSMSFITPRIKRKKGTGSFSYDATPDWNLFFLFSRENQFGVRPIGFLFNSSPSASGTGYGVEVPEPIDYFNNVIQAGTEYGRKDWGVQVSYMRSFFENNVNTLVVDNPYVITDSTNGAAVGRLDLYPDNSADYLNFAGAFDLGKYVRVMASITPGWLRQNDPFVPYTSNSVRLAQTGALPASSLDGKKQTLAMNYTLVATPVKKFQVKAIYRHYDYNNNTPVLEFTPVQGDKSAPGLDDNEHRATSFNKKTFEVTGNWYFAKRSSLKIGYEGEWFDREHRDVDHSMENSFIAAVDWSPKKEFLLRAAYRHSNREPDTYQDPDSEGTCEASALAAARAAFEFPDIHPCARRFDEAARLRDRGEVIVEYSPLDKLTLSGTFTTIQDDFNRKGGTNSATPLNYLTGSDATIYAYYLYGVQKDLSYNYTFDGNYAVSPEVSLFLEYSHEKYHRTMISRYRTPESTSGSANGCGPNSLGAAFRGPCDSANNDWWSAARDFVDVWATGIDFYLGKKVYLTTYYSLAAGKGRVFTRALGTQPDDFLTNPTPFVPAPPVLPEDRFVMTTTSAATDYPETVNRSHEVSVIFKYKLTRNIMPKLEYRYQQFDYKDYQTSPMTPYMGCIQTTGVAAVPGVSPGINPVVAPGCPLLGTTAASSIPSPFYPYFVVGDNSAAQYYFLGVDKPSFRAHSILASIQYTF